MGQKPFGCCGPLMSEQALRTASEISATSARGFRTDIGTPGLGEAQESQVGSQLRYPFSCTKCCFLIRCVELVTLYHYPAGLLGVMICPPQTSPHLADRPPPAKSASACRVRDGPQRAGRRGQDMAGAGANAEHAS